MKLFDTSFPNNYSRTLLEEKRKDLSPEYTDMMANVIFTAVASILNAAKKKDTPAVFEFRRMNQDFVAAAICEYVEGDGTNPGNYVHSWTTNESDVPANATKMSLNDPTTHQYFKAIGGDKYGMGFKTPDNLIACVQTFVEELIKWLDENAKEDEETSIELDGVFEAKSAVEGGEKVFAIEPAGEIKQLIKDDNDTAK